MILLDDAVDRGATLQSRFYDYPAKTITATSEIKIRDVLENIQDWLVQDLRVVVLFSYEFGEWLQGLAPRHSPIPFISAYAFNIFSKPDSKIISTKILKNSQKINLELFRFDILSLHKSIQRVEFSDDIKRIHSFISAGDTYQINHSFRLKGKILGETLDLYSRLRQRQPCQFGAYIDIGDRKILSFSPELFVSCTDGVLTSKPMKGTRSVHIATAQSLANDPKDRAENLMIVDLIRNDLSKISELGSVEVPSLFDVETVGELYQMTSTVKSRIRPDVGLYELLEAIFPCGSVTGAPKKRSMEIIQELETEPRGIYCGAIGWFDPPKEKGRGLGDFCMSVAIRTLEVFPDNTFTLGVGAGITIDSDAGAEWEECLLKARFLTELPSPVGLIETMRVENGEIVRRKAHLDRLFGSAKALRIPLNEMKLEYDISKSTESLINTKDVQRLRLHVHADGEIKIQLTPLKPIELPVRIFWADDILPKGFNALISTNPLLTHKIDEREIYDAGWKKAEALGGFDAIFTNEKGEITEGGRTNLLIKLNGQWLTPSRSCGLLPGIMREALLCDAKWSIKEQTITREQVLVAEEIMVVNSLRGVMPAIMQPGVPTGL